MLQLVVSILLAYFNLLYEVVALQNSTNRLHSYHVLVHHLVIRDLIIRHYISHVHDTVFIAKMSSYLRVCIVVEEDMLGRVVRRI